MQGVAENQQHAAPRAPAWGLPGQDVSLPPSPESGGIFDSYSTVVVRGEGSHLSQERRVPWVVCVPETKLHLAILVCDSHLGK